MQKDIMDILNKVPLKCLYDDVPARLWKKCNKGNAPVMICLAVEYGRILGKREERARRAAKA